MRKLNWLTWSILAALITALALYAFDRFTRTYQDANELLDAGFIIIDPEGHQVERFVE